MDVSEIYDNDYDYDKVTRAFKRLEKAVANPAYIPGKGKGKLVFPCPFKQQNMKMAP